MYFDDYSTSFQSLMGPMYNVQANYSANIGGAAGAAGAGAGSVNNTSIYNMGYISPMMNVGVGQFGADQLIKGDQFKNNYYTRPIAAHKKKDELPTILGIVGTALGTAALLYALTKGRGRKAPSPRPNPTPGTVPTPTPTPTPTTGTIPTPNPNNVRGLLPHKPIDPNSLPVVRYNHPGFSGNSNAGSNIGGSGSNIGGTGSNISGTGSSPVNTGAGAAIGGNGSLPSTINNPVSTPIITGVPAGRNSAPRIQDIAVDVPFEEIGRFSLPASNVRGTLPAPDAQALLSGSSVRGYLPLPDARTSNSLPVLASNNSKLKPISEFLPKNESLVGNLPAAEGTKYLPLPDSRTKTSLPIPMNVAKAEQNLFAVRPDLASQGNVVYTTHTPATLQEGYSIGANAKGADKLAQLLAQMQG
ncbi:MAG: hypothetical protein KHX03_00510 [Clostridium sp.]|nr:hypothetical protein [Clostridium sp.]